MSEKLMPSACEVDVAGTVAMYGLQLASGRPSALVDWNNNYGDDPDKCVFFHCGNWAKALLPDITIATAPILGTTLGEANIVGRDRGGERLETLDFHDQRPHAGRHDLYPPLRQVGVGAAEHPGDGLAAQPRAAIRRHRLRHAQQPAVRRRQHVHGHD